MSTLHPSDDLLQQHLDGTLSAAQMAEVDAHLRDCPACTSLRAEYAEIFGGLAAMPEPLPPPRFVESVMAQVAVQQRDLARQRAVAAFTFAGSIALALVCFVAAGSHVWAHEVSAWSAGLVELGRGLHVAADLLGSLAVAVRVPLMASCAVLCLPMLLLLHRVLPERALPAST